MHITHRPRYYTTKTPGWKKRSREVYYGKPLASKTCIVDAFRIFVLCAHCYIRVEQTSLPIFLNFIRDKYYTPCNVDSAAFFIKSLM